MTLNDSRQHLRGRGRDKNRGGKAFASSDNNCRQAMETPVNLPMQLSYSYNDMGSVEPQLFSERGNRRGGRGMRNRGRNQGGIGRGRGRGDVGQDDMDAGGTPSFNDRMDGYIRGGQGRGRGQREGRGSRGRGRGNRGGGRRGHYT